MPNNKIYQILLSLGDFLIFQILQNELAFILYSSNAQTLDMIKTILTNNVTALIIWFAFLCIRLTISNEKVKIYFYDKIFVMMFSIFILIANSFNKIDSSLLITYNIKTFILFVISTILLYSLGICFLKWIKFLINSIKFKEEKNTRFNQLFSKHIFICSFFIIIIAWIPYAIIRYPLVSEWDAYHQILQGLGQESFNYNWPIASTFFLTSLLKFGYFIFKDVNVAAFFMVLTQMIICATCFSYSMVIINKLKVNPIIKNIILLIYAIAPIYPRYTTAIVKDAIFSSLVILFIAVLIDCFILENKKWWNYIILVVSAFMMSIFRSNGIYIIIFSLVGILFYLLKNKKSIYWKIAICFVATICMYEGYSAIIKSNGYNGASIAEALSITFQQTARYVKYYSGDVTSEEKEIIGDILDYELLAEKYNPRLSDYVKSTYHGDKYSLEKYFHVWVKQFFKHPMIYFTATFNNSFEFFYPGAEESESGLYKTTNNDTKVKLFDESVMNKKGKEQLEKYIILIEKNPLGRLVCDTGIQFWIVIYLFLYAILKKKGRCIYILLPSIVGILVCIAGPTYTWNGIRYALPIIYATPIIVATFIHEKSV